MGEKNRWRSVSQEDWEVALARETVIRSLSDQVEVTAKEVAKATAELGISRSLLFRLLAKFRKRPQVSSLLPGKRGRRPAARVLSVTTEAVIQEAIVHFHLRRENPHLSDLLKEIERRCREKGLKVPNFRTVKRRILAIDAREKVKKRQGAKVASDRFRPTQILSTANLLPLERVQIDHTLVDAIVVDEGARLPIGRPWLTLAIDVASRAVLGFSISLESPSAVSVALAPVQAVLPKDLWLADRELEVPWPMWGMPELLQVDNAPEFHSRALRTGAQEYGIRIDYRPAATPHFGGHIERLIGTTMGAVHLLPGTTFSNVAQRGNYSSEKASSLTLVELERWLALQVTGVYHARVHSSILKPPLAAWKEALSGVAEHLENPPMPKRSFWIFCRRNGA